MTSCTEKSQKEMIFPTIAETIQYGSKVADVKVLTQVSKGNEQVLLLLNKSGSLTLASITKTEKGFKWYNQMPFVRVDNIFKAEYQTESGVKIPLLIGKVDDQKASKVLVEKNGSTTELKINGGYFIGVDLVDYDKITPVV